MRWTIIGLLSLVVLITQTSCGQASFTGNSKKSDGNSPAPQTPPGGNTGNVPGPTTPIPGTPGTVPGGTTGTVPVPGTPGTTPGTTTGPIPLPGTPGAPGYKPIPGSQCTTPPCQSNVPVPEYGPIGQVEQPTPNTVVFGKDQVLHIGNGNFPATSCMEQVSTIPLSGSVFFFQFQVNQDNTSVSVNVASICGVDFGSGTLQLAQGTAKVGQTTLPRGAKSLGLPSYVLNRGVYNVYVYSGKGNGTDGPTWDVDDFVVGNVQVTANQPITPGIFGAYK